MGRLSAFFYTSVKDGKRAIIWTRSPYELSAEMKVARYGAPDWTDWTGGRLDYESLRKVAEKFEPDHIYVTEDENANV